MTFIFEHFESKLKHDRFWEIYINFRLVAAWEQKGELLNGANEFIRWAWKFKMGELFVTVDF